MRRAAFVPDLAICQKSSTNTTVNDAALRRHVGPELEIELREVQAPLVYTK